MDEQEKAQLADCKIRCWKESVQKELKLERADAPFRGDYPRGSALTNARSSVVAPPPHRHDPSAPPPAAPDPASPYGAHYAQLGAAEVAPRARYLFPATTAQEIGWLKQRAGRGGAAVQTGGYLRGCSHGHRYSDALKDFAAAAKSPAVVRAAPAAGTNAWHP